MPEKLDPRQVVTFEELLRAMMIEQEAIVLLRGAEEGKGFAAVTMRRI